MGGILTPRECIVWFIESILQFKFYLAYQWWTNWRFIIHTFRIIFVKTLKDIWSYKGYKNHGNERGKDFFKCQNAMDSYVIPYQTCYGIIQYIVDEDDH
jgi:hypothetical protein